MSYARFYALGSSLSSLQNFAELGIVEPFQDPYVPFGIQIDAGDLLVYGHGLASTSFRWGFLSLAHRDLLKGYCPGMSAVVYVRLRNDDWEWCICRAVMVWQPELPPVSGVVLDFSIVFRILDNYGVASP